jgi:hypothetical protein
VFYITIFIKCKLSSFLFFLALHNSETSPGSLKAVFKSPMENYSTIVSTDNDSPSTTRRFIITPVTLKNTSSSKE